MTLGKNFRLPSDIRPKSYDADLRIDLPEGRFEGRLTLTLALASTRRAIVLHAVDLEVTSAEASGATANGQAGGRAGGLFAAPSTDPVSQTVTLTFSEELPAGPTKLVIAYRGAFSPGLRGLYRAGPLAVTQFEAADARRLFPCFDEPSFKAVWRLSVSGVPDGAVMVLVNIASEWTK